MQLNRMEQIAMIFFDDGNPEMTIQRLRLAAALSPKQEVKKMLCELIDKLQAAMPVNRQDTVNTN